MRSRCSARRASSRESSATSRRQAEAAEWRVSALLALGDIDAARDELAIASEAAQHTRQPFILHVAEHYRSALALLEGRLAEAEEAAERSRELGPAAGRPRRLRRLRRPDVLGAPRAGPPRRARARDPRARGRRARRRRVAARPRRDARRARHAGARRPSELDRVCADGSRVAAQRPVAGVAHLLDRRRRRGGARRGSPRSSTRCSRRWRART